MNIMQKGMEGERLAMIFIKEHYNCESLFQADWVTKIDGTWYVVEVKRKDLFLPPPFLGTGLNVSQVKSRLEFYKDTGIRCLLMFLNPEDNNVYVGWLDELDKGEKFDTKNNIRIYPLENFKWAGVVPEG